MRHAFLMTGSLSALSLCLAVPLAEARSRSDRTGFTFGTTLRSIGSDDSTSPGPESDKKTHSINESMLVTPYMGYAFENFSLGVAYSSESVTSSATETTPQGESTERTNKRMTQGLSVFSRFMFAEVFFFESGLGLFQNTFTVSSEARTTQDEGTFAGKADRYMIKGTGPGYHAGFGMELPITAGFYFTSMYQTRMVTLWDYKGGSDLGGKRSLTQKREVLFGFAYYNR